MLKSSVAFAAAMVCWWGVCLAHAQIETTLCSIAAHAARFHHKIVRVRGAALNGYEASVLIDNNKDGSWNEACGQIHLDFHSSANDLSTKRFLRLFEEQVREPPCNADEEIRRGLMHLYDPNAPPPIPCFKSYCIHCPRYRIEATFVGKVRYSKKEPGHARFGHLGMFDLQLDVSSVSDVDATDMTDQRKE